MNQSLILAVIFITLFGSSCCSLLATKGYVLSSPRVRRFLIGTGLGDVINRKAVALYDASNFRYASDQGTDIRKAEMEEFEILEVDPNRKRTGLSAQEQVIKVTSAEDRKYSEKLFGVLNEMDRNGCVSRLLCEIGADPTSFGLMGFKIHHYLKSAPPVTWNSATYLHLEAFQGGLSGTYKCNQHYTTCNYDLRRVMKFLWLFLKPISLN